MLQQPWTQVKVHTLHSLYSYIIILASGIELIFGHYNIITYNVSTGSVSCKTPRKVILVKVLRRHWSSSQVACDIPLQLDRQFLEANCHETISKNPRVYSSTHIPKPRKSIQKLISIEQTKIFSVGFCTLSEFLDLFQCNVCFNWHDRHILFERQAEKMNERFTFSCQITSGNVLLSSQQNLFIYVE